MSAKKNDTVYVRLLEGTAAFVPCEAKLQSTGEFEIVRNPYVDLEEDATSIWEFLPGDTIECELKDGEWFAKRFVRSTLPDRKLHQLIFLIVESLGKIEVQSLQGYENEIKCLCDGSIKQKEHPIVQAWLSKHCE